MIRSLVSIEVDLASSLAIRYACSLGNVIQMELCPVYVKGYKPDEPTTGIGWARRTWEREIVETGKEEISEMISSEMDSCPAMVQPRVIYGDRDFELQKLMEDESFDLYVEGAPYPFTPATIHKRVHMKFYQRLQRPMIWLRGLRKINQVLLLCDSPGGTELMARSMAHLWGNCSKPVHLSAIGGSQWAVSPEKMLQPMEKAKETLVAAGCQATIEREVLLADGKLDEEILKQYGMIVVALDRKVKKDSPVLQWLAQVREPLMVVLQ
jgi:hypothetical protein